MNIRPATKQDAPQIKSLILELGYDTPTDDFVSRIDIYNESEDSYVFVAEEDGRITGLITGYVNPYFHRSGNIFRIMALAVTKDSRGIGIGTALCDEIGKVAQKRGCDRIEVTAGAHRKDDAHRFYQRIGFVPYDGVRFVKTFE